MKCFLSILCLIVGLGIGAVGGFFAGEAVILKQQFAYQTGLMAAMADDVHPTKKKIDKLLELNRNPAYFP